MRPHTRARSVLVVFFLLGLVALSHGIGGVLRGQIAIPVRNAPALVLAASGPDQGAFIVYTGLCIVAGLVFVVGSIVLGYRSLFGGPSVQREVVQAVEKVLKR